MRLNRKFVLMLFYFLILGLLIPSAVSWRIKLLQVVKESSTSSWGKVWIPK